MSARYLGSKVTAVAASVAIFGGGAAWIAAEDAGSQESGATQPAPGTIVRHIYLLQRTAPDGTTYFEPLAAARPSTQPTAAPQPVTRTRAS